MSERCGHSGIPIAPGDDESTWPNFVRYVPQLVPIFFGPTASQKDSGAANFPRQLLKNRTEPLGRGEAEVGWGQFAVFYGTQLVTVALNQYPGGFSAPTFHAENSFGWAHDWYLAVFAPFGKAEWGATAQVGWRHIGPIGPIGRIRPRLVFER
jgi:hypothetical protein